MRGDDVGEHLAGHAVGHGGQRRLAGPREQFVEAPAGHGEGRCFLVHRVLVYAPWKARMRSNERRAHVVGHRLLADDPGEDELVGDIEQRLELGQAGVVQFVEMSVGEAAEEQIDLAHAAVPAAEFQPPAPHCHVLRVASAVHLIPVPQ